MYFFQFFLFKSNFKYINQLTNVTANSACNMSRFILNYIPYGVDIDADDMILIWAFKLRSTGCELTCNS